MLCRSIRTATVKKYLDAISELFLSVNLHDPVKNLQGIRSPYIEAVLKEHLRWETVPNRREPLTYKMVDYGYMSLRTSMIHDTNFLPDSLEECICDWLILGMQTGARLSEWCQDHKKLQKTKLPEKNIDGSSKAFTFHDFNFLNSDNVRRSNDFTSHINDAQHVQITWRYQKNNDNGQKLIFTANDEKPYRCPVRAAMRIRARAQKYGITVTSPLAFFREENGTIAFITSKHVEIFLQNLARKVYNITDKQELARFTCHSIRVGACVVLHENNCPGEFIQVRLRWRSLAFLLYLRNTTKLAELHNNAVNAA